MRRIIQEGINDEDHKNLITLDYNDINEILNKSKKTLLIKSASLKDLIKKANKVNHLKNTDGKM